MSSLARRKPGPPGRKHTWTGGPGQGQLHRCFGLGAFCCTTEMKLFLQNAVPSERCWVRAMAMAHIHKVCGSSSGGLTWPASYGKLRTPAPIMPAASVVLLLLLLLLRLLLLRLLLLRRRLLQLLLLLVLRQFQACLAVACCRVLETKDFTEDNPTWTAVRVLLIVWCNCLFFVLIMMKLWVFVFFLSSGLLRHQLKPMQCCKHCKQDSRVGFSGR